MTNTKPSFNRQQETRKDLTDMRRSSRLQSRTTGTTTTPTPGQTKTPPVRAKQNKKGNSAGKDGLADIFYDTKHPAGYSNPPRLHRGAQGKHTRHEVLDYLQGEDTYTLHKQVRKHFPRNITYADTVDDCWQSDLADFSNLKEDNDHYLYILCTIDVFSRYAWTIPIKDKKANTVLEAFKTLFEATDRRPGRAVITDKGGELNNVTLKRYFKQQGVDLFHTNNPDTKCSIAERFIRTLRLWMQKIFTHKEKYRYIDGILQDVTYAYNHKYHRSIKMTPHEASQPKRVLEVYHNLYSSRLKQKKVKPQLRKGDFVRIAREKKKFEKGHYWNWSEAIYQVTRVIPHQYPLYKIADIDHQEELEGSFYSWELSKVHKPDTFKIEYIVDTKGVGASKKHLVHWRGYPVESRSWVLAKNIEET